MPNLVTLWRYRDLPEALLAQSKLESAGIDCDLADDNIVRVNWLYSNAFGGVRLQVAEQDAEAALSVLQEPAPETYSAEEVGEKYHQPKCPLCGSMDVYRENLNRPVTYTSFMIFSVPIYVRADFYRCESCGHEWMPQEDTEEVNSPEHINTNERPRILVATSNKGKLRDFAAAAREYALEVLPLPNLNNIPEPAETGSTFADNATLKAIAYSLHAPGELVIADDSGLEVAALGGAPGIHSARYAATMEHTNASDRENNNKLLYELGKLPESDRSARFVCVIAAARDGKVLGTFTGEAKGEILQSPLGRNGFGYDPLFFVPEPNKSFAELDADEKAQYSHRGAAFRKFLEWFNQQTL